jgi:hypothetical protein
MLRALISRSMGERSVYNMHRSMGFCFTSKTLSKQNGPRWQVPGNYGASTREIATGPSKSQRHSLRGSQCSNTAPEDSFTPRTKKKDYFCTVSRDGKIHHRSVQQWSGFNAKTKGELALERRPGPAGCRGRVVPPPWLWLGLGMKKDPRVKRLEHRHVPPRNKTSGFDNAMVHCALSSPGSVTPRRTVLTCKSVGAGSRNADHFESSA